MGLFSKIFGKKSEPVTPIGLDDIQGPWEDVLKPGDIITEEVHNYIFEHSFHCLQQYERENEYFQTQRSGFDYAWYEDENGEKHSARVFHTFGRKEDGNFTYYGECFLGGTLDRSKDMDGGVEPPLEEEAGYQEDV